VVAALATGSLIGAATPAFADANLGVDVNPGSTTLTVGQGGQSITVKISNTGDQDSNNNVQLTIRVPFEGQVTINNRPNGCDQDGNTLDCQLDKINKGQSRSLTLQLSPPAQSDIQPGQQRSNNGTVQINNGGSASFGVTLKAQAPTTVAPVTAVAGTINDSVSGDPLANANVVMQDGADKQHTTGTDSKGKFKFTSTADDPITPGRITISAGKDGYANSAPKTQDAKSGQSITNVRINLKPTAAASASAVPESSGGAFASGPAADNTTAAAADGPTPGTKTGSGTSTLSLVLIVLGGLLVLLGIGAIVMLLRRRGDDDDDDGNEGPQQGPPPGAPPVYRDAPLADPTMVGGHTSAMSAPAMAGRSNANDKTAIVPPLGVPQDPYAPGHAPGSYGATGVMPGYGAADYARPADYNTNRADATGYMPAENGRYGGATGDAYSAGAAGGPAGPGGYGQGGPGGQGGAGNGYGAAGVGGYRDDNGAGYRGADNGYGAGGEQGYGAGGDRGYGAGGANGYGPSSRPGDGYAEAGYRGGEPPRAGGAAGYGQSPDDGYGTSGAGYGAGSAGASGAAGTYGARPADPRSADPRAADPRAGEYGAGEYGAGEYGAGRHGNDYGDRGGYGDDRGGRYDAGGYGAGAPAPGNPRPAGGPTSGPGYGPQNGGYEPEQYTGGRRAAPPADYDARGGYGPAGGGYDRDDYGRPPAPRSGSYDDAAYGAQDRQAAPPAAQRGERRSIDWLDD
jgi:hypothetical protein